MSRLQDFEPYVGSAQPPRPGGSGLSPRQQIAARFGVIVGVPVERIAHGYNKHFYRVMSNDVCIDVHYHTYIRINGTRFANEVAASQELSRLQKR